MTLDQLPYLLTGWPYGVSAGGHLYRLPGWDSRGRVWHDWLRVTPREKRVTTTFRTLDLRTREVVFRKRERVYRSFRLYADGRERHLSEKKVMALRCRNPAFAGSM